MVPLKTDVFVKLWGLPVIVWSNGRENEHFLRFNFPHNCWKETKLSVVNIESHCVKRVPCHILWRVLTCLWSLTTRLWITTQVCLNVGMVVTSLGLKMSQNCYFDNETTVRLLRILAFKFCVTTTVLCCSGTLHCEWSRTRLNHLIILIILILQWLDNMIRWPYCLIKLHILHFIFGQL